MMIEKPIYVNALSEKEIRQTHGWLGYIFYKVAALIGVKSVVQSMLHKVRPNADGKTVPTAYYTVQQAMDEAAGLFSEGDHDYTIQIVDEEYK